MIYLDGQYIGDIWCYGIDEEREKMAMLSYSIFEKEVWGLGITTIAVELFLEHIFKKYAIQKIGAFTYSNNYASVRVLEKNQFDMVEEFEEDTIRSRYFEKARS